MKLLSLSVAAMLILGPACGGDDDAFPSAGGDDSPAASSDGTSGDDDDEDGGGSSSSGGPLTDLGSGRAVVTIGDETFEFDLSVGCIYSFGAIGGGGSAVSGEDVSVQIDIVPEEFGTSSIRVDDEREDRPVTWEADEELASVYDNVGEGNSQIDDFEIDGATASGTATFVDAFAASLSEPISPLKGSFSINCEQ